MIGDSKKRFFIQDEQSDLRNMNNKIQLKKDADREFIKLSDIVKCD